MNKLPSEILVDILKYLNRAELRLTRLVCTSWTEACNTILQNRLTVLYLHPTTLSLRQFVDICAHPVFSQNIRELVILGSFVVLPYTTGTDALDTHFTVDALPYALWPDEYPSSRTQSEKRSALSRDVQMSTHTVLLQSIQKLPKLCALTLQAKVRQPGFNQVSEVTINAYTRRCFDIAYREAASRNARAFKECASQFGLMTFDLSMAVLNSRPFTRFEVLDRMQGLWLGDFVRHMTGAANLPFSTENRVLIEHINRLDRSTKLYSSFASLTEMSLPMLTYRDGPSQSSVWRTFCRIAISKAHALESLDLTIEIPRTSRRDLATSFRDSVIAKVLDFPDTLLRLRDFGIRIRPNEVQGVNVSKPHKRDPGANSYYRQSPAAGVFVDAVANDLSHVDPPPMLAFLQRHAGTLRSVRIANYHASMSGDGFYGRNHLSITCEMVRVLKQAPNLTDFSWTMRRCYHHAWCKHAYHQADRSGCPLSCGRYTERVDVEMYTRLAARMGVQFNEKSQNWDFATGRWPPPDDM